MVGKSAHSVSKGRRAPDIIMIGSSADEEQLEKYHSSYYFNKNEQFS